MDSDTILGCLIVLASLGVLTYLVFWSRRAIDRIARSNTRSAREIQRELRRGR